MGCRIRRIGRAHGKSWSPSRSASSTSRSTFQARSTFLVSRASWRNLVSALKWRPWVSRCTPCMTSAPCSPHLAASKSSTLLTDDLAQRLWRRPYALVTTLGDPSSRTQWHLLLDSRSFRSASVTHWLCCQHADVPCLPNLDRLPWQPGSGDWRCYHRGYVCPSNGRLWHLHLGLFRCLWS